jgi:hypothetical protein
MKNNNNTLLTLKAKTFVILLLLFVANSLPALGQTQVTRYTPLSTPVTAYNQMPGMSSDDKNDWSSFVKFYYPDAKELNEPSATNNFNCHGYAWHVSEGGDQVWIGLGNYDSNPYIMEDIYWEDGSYIRLNSESGANKISYYNGNHSAIQTSIAGTYHSKWGNGPLMEHSHDYGPPSYHMSYRYYYDEPVISGDNILCYPSSKTYSVQDFYDVIYNWSTSSNLQINGSNTNRSVSISPKSSSNSSGYIQVSIFIPAYNKTRVITKNVWAGKPVINQIVGPQHAASAQLPYSYSATPYNSLAGATYSWSVSPSYYTLDYGGNYASIAFPSDGDYRVYANAQNSCGSSNTAQLFVAVGIYEPWKIAPNPASDYFSISLSDSQPNSISDSSNGKKSLEIKPNTSYSLKIINSMGVQVYSTSNMGNNFTVSTSNLKDGIYIVIISDGQNEFKKNIFIKH